jgi:hypothetical protein
MTKINTELLASSDFEVRTKSGRTLLFDIETTPLLIWSYDTYNANALKVEQDWYMLCWSAKWLDSKQIISKSIWDYKGYKPKSTDDRELVEDLWKLLNEADFVVGHNARKFDVRKTMAKIIQYRLPPLPPSKIIDTWEQSKKLAAFTYHRLGSLGEKLEIGAKLPTDKELWFAAMGGDEKAQNRMVRYCRQDTNLLEQLYLTLRPYMPNHPNAAVLAEKKDGCKKCTSQRLQARGFAVTATGKRQRYQCIDCGSWMQGKHQPLSTIR